MNSTARIILFALAVAAAFSLLLSAMLKLPAFGLYPGPYGDLVMARVQDERHTGQGVAAVTFDYRGFDTMGEEFILFSAVAGVVMLLRPKKDEQENEDTDACKGNEPEPPGPAVMTLGTILFPITLVMGVSMILHGHLTPGGGFQGGVLSASAFLFIYLTGEFEDYQRLTPDHSLELVEACAAGAFVLTGLAAILAGGLFLANVLPYGEKGKLLSAGTLPFLNVVVGAEVTAGIMLILTAFLRQALELRRRARK